MSGVDDSRRCHSVLVKWAILGGLLALVTPGCRHTETGEPEAAACDGAPMAYRIKGKALVGDVNADGTGDRVTLRVDGKRPARCRHLLVVQLSGGRTAVAPVAPLPWPGTDPQLLLLAEIDGRPGLEPVVTLSPVAVYRPGAVFTLSRGTLVRMRLERVPVPVLFPFSDEFPAGVDCAGQPGTIVVTQSEFAGGSDGPSHVVRSFHRAAGARFGFVRDQRFQLGVGAEAGERWPEIRDDPFRHCLARVP
jgi:hypothetical protein